MSEKRRAVVLGGGGPVGVAWEAGLAAGLAASGVALSLADQVGGTSAGSITGAMLKGGADAEELAGQVGAMFASSIGESGVDRVDMSGFATVMESLIGAVASTEGSQQERCAAVGRVALDAKTISEEAFVGTFERTFGGRDWPTGFSCTAVNAETGEFAVWDEAAAVPLERAVASSCSVPGIYPPITINGGRYTDGGVRSPLNADLASGADAVVVVSCFPLEVPAELSNEMLDGFFAAQKTEIESLRAGGAAVELIVPDEEFLAVSEWGLSLMDFSRIGAAVDAGMRLGKAEAERLRAIW